MFFPEIKKFSRNELLDKYDATPCRCTPDMKQALRSNWLTEDEFRQETDRLITDRGGILEHNGMEGCAVDTVLALLAVPAEISLHSEDPDKWPKGKCITYHSNAIAFRKSDEDGKFTATFFEPGYFKPTRACYTTRPTALVNKLCTSFKIDSIRIMEGLQRDRDDIFCLLYSCRFLADMQEGKDFEDSLVLKYEKNPRRQWPTFSQTLF